jgi:hypothetical protein
MLIASRRVIPFTSSVMSSTKDYAPYWVEQGATTTSPNTRSSVDHITDHRLVWL